MNRNKKIAISCIVAIVFIIFTNYITNKYFKGEQYNVYALNQVLLEGEELSIDKLDVVQVNKKDDYINENNINIYMEKYTAKENLNKGQLLSKELLSNKDEEKENKVYVVLPITNFKNAGGYQIEKGNTINVYYTSKQSQTGEIIKDYERVYASVSSDSMVTIKLLERVTVVNIYNDMGEESKKGEAFKQIMIKTDIDTAQKIANLKEQGVFDICLVE